LASDERELWSSPSWRLRESRRPAGSAQYTDVWTLTDSCAVTITDRRLIFVCTKFVKGQSHHHLFTPLSLELALEAKSALQAKAIRAGRAVVGSVRFQWPQFVVSQRQRTKFGKGSAQIGLDCRDSDGSLVRIWFGVSPPDAVEPIAESLTRHVANFRLHAEYPFQRSLSTQALDMLKAQGEAPSCEVQTLKQADTREFRFYSLPGSLDMPRLE
jgi:hypothetical protein